jgi:hypothetical protein
MLEFIKYVTSNFGVFVGTFLLFGIVGEVIVRSIQAIRGCNCKEDDDDENL